MKEDILEDRDLSQQGRGDLQYILEIVRERVWPSANRFDLIRLRGDASNRRYFRLRINEGENSLILMKLARPESFKESEEKITSCAIPVKELPYIDISNHLYRCNISVPRLFYYDKGRGLLFLEDLGDLSLEDIIKGSNRVSINRYYEMAIDELIKIQIDGTKEKEGSCIAFGRVFDIPLLMWEFDHFLEYGIEGYYQTQIGDSERERIREIFFRISEVIAHAPRCLTHRDYHSRNLMIQNDRIRVIDFQDALLGPPSYDLASLLRDSYTVLEEDLVDELIGYYLREGGERGGLRWDRDEFRRLFDLTSIQRNLKAAGRFAYIASVKGNDNYLKYIPNTLCYVKKNLIRYEELEELRGLLGRYVREI